MDAVPAAEDVTISIPELTTMCRDLLTSRGMPDVDADVVARVLVRTTARGFRSHGVELLPLYVNWIKAGAIRVDATIAEVQSTPVSAIIDGGGAMGQLVAMRAADAVASRARDTGIAIVAARNSNHVGALGHYVLSCAEQGLIALMWSSAPPTIHAPGGSARVIGNGPTAYSIPRGAVAPVVFDAAFSVGSGGKVALARQRGESLPPGWIVDRDGRPTRDPVEAPGGAFVPVGGHKGFGLAVLAELMSTCLSGAVLTSELPSMAGPPDRPFGLGHTIVAIDPAKFATSEVFAQRVDAFTKPVDESGAALPGDGAHEREQVAQRSGIRFDAASWSRIAALRFPAAG